MKKSGMPRKKAEQIVNQEIMKMFGFPQTNVQVVKPKQSKTEKKNYTQTNYPHYLPAKTVQKFNILITLRMSKPKIWRRIEVPSNITLRHLGDLILDLMGWSNEHLNQFIGKDKFYLPYYQNTGDNASFMKPNDFYQEDYTLADLIEKVGDKCTFEYDFGDSWEHIIELSIITEYAPDVPHEIVFVGAEGACPPEDCGGIPFYNELVKTHNKRRTGKHLEDYEIDMLLGSGLDYSFDPKYVSLVRCRGVVEKYNK